MKRNSLLVILFSIILTACAVPTPAAAPSTTAPAAEVAPTATKTEKPTPTATATEIPATPTKTPIPEPKEGDWKIEKLPNGEDVKVFWFDLKDADGSPVGGKWFQLLTPYPLYWNDFIQVFPVNAWLEFDSNGDNPIQAIEIKPKRDANGTTMFDGVALFNLEDRIKKDSGISDNQIYVSGIMDADPTSAVFKYTLGEGKDKKEFTLAPNRKTGMDVFILRNDPNLVDKHGFVPGTMSNKYPFWTANWGNTKADESVRTAIVSERPVGELTDAEWMGLLLLNATSLLTKTDQTTPFTSDSGNFARYILLDPNPFIKIIRVAPTVSPTSTP